MSETNHGGFSALNLAPKLLQKLDRLGFVTPTPIQSAAIPYALKGRDVVGIAQTGTGKTLAFGIPTISRLNEGEVALVLAPTRELAQQIQETLISLGMRTALLIGGAPMGRQVSQLRSRPDAIIATPGRLMDHMNQRTVDLRRVRIAILDEADRMLDMGFAPAIKKILEVTPRDRQTMLFTATMPKEIAELANSYLRNPERVEVTPTGTAPELVEQELVFVKADEKPTFLGGLLVEHTGSVLVFAKTRHGARKLAKAVRNLGHTAAEIHSDRTLAQRREALSGFKSGTYRILVATDIAARGIDVKEISLVVNYDVPEKPEDYVHRIGRTGRAGANGKAITIATPDQHRDIRDIERLLNRKLPLSQSSTASVPRPSVRPGMPRQSRGRGRLFQTAGAR